MTSLYATPIKQRPPAALLHNIVFNGFFLCAILTLHGFQLLASPLLLAEQSRPFFWAAQNHVQRQFAVLLTFISRFFGPTKLRLTSEGDLALEKILQRDSTGKVVSLSLPQRSALMANHQASALCAAEGAWVQTIVQVYLDWLYCWIILYNASLHGALTIILKASLKWTPVVGPAMQLFGFVFLARKWEDDRLTLSSKLLSMARKAREKANPLVLLIFPEGTLVSKDTRPLSKKFAEKAGINAGGHAALIVLAVPRSTGLLFCLRSLAKGVPDLKLIDATIAYPGIPSGGYGQEYYTLQSVFGANVPPPLVHIHLRQFDVNGQVPIGDVDVAKGARGAADTTAEERTAFDAWLRGRWLEKDKMIGRFLDEGRLVDQDVHYVDLDAAPRRDGDIAILLGTMIASLMGWYYVARFLYRFL